MTGEKRTELAPAGMIRLRLYGDGRVTLQSPTEQTEKLMVLCSDEYESDGWEWVRMPDDNGRRLGFYGLLLWLAPSMKDGVEIHDVPWSEIRRRVQE